jgi:hypothetical protein
MRFTLEHTGACGELYTDFCPSSGRTRIGRTLILTVSRWCAFASNIHPVPAGAGATT